MKDPSKHIEKIFLDERYADHPVALEIMDRAATIPMQIVNDQDLLSLYNRPYPASLSSGKKHLFLTKNQGAFFKPCPATKEYQCCDYHVLNIGMNCPMDCVYCILQAYLNNPWLSFFINTDELFQELDQVLASNKGRFLRIGTGEFTDSLALDRLTHLSQSLVEYMADKSNTILELKTKSAVIDNLYGLNHGGRTIISWSLNAPSIMQKEELRTATLDERLEAAQKCASWGYKLAFHFDPIILHPGWKEGYTHTIQRLFDSVPAQAIAWISMGALRYLPHLKSIAGVRFPQSQFFYQEFVPGLDNKSRYFRTQRVQLYSYIAQLLHQKISPSTCLYFCMESNEIWQQVFGYSPEEKGGLAAMLDKAATKTT